MKHSDILSLTLSQAKQELSNKNISSVELTQCYVERMTSLNSTYHAYITCCEDLAIDMAKKSDARRQKGNCGILEGIPLAIKDVFCTKGVRTTFSSKMMQNFVPEYSSTVTQRLEQCGGVFLGKTNLDEFCMGSMNTYTLTSPVANPWNTSCVSGGSSGGSAAAVAAGMALGSVGSDTGGSIRQPASFCGIVGVRPTYGRVSRYGMGAFSSSLDQAGPFGRTVEDAAHIFQAICGHDPKDSTSRAIAPPDVLSIIRQSVKGMKVGIPKEFYEASYPEDIRRCWDKSREILEDAGCQTKMVSLPYVSFSLPCYYLIVCAEAASNMARYDGVKYGVRCFGETLEEMYCATRSAGFGPEVKRRIIIGTYILSHGNYDAYYGKATRIRHLIRDDFARIFQDVDILLMPTTPTTTFPFSQAPNDPVTVYLNDVLTVPVNVGGICGISVPCGVSDKGLPLGIQILAPAFEDGRLFQFGSVLEKGSNFPLLPFLEKNSASCKE
ncbi:MULTISPECIES: Asp-tRNA(Asn)/Glu-tRNA(Gln) amidotransferase subunit GatA [Holospora]|uniref:Glutamyl-tRNA(Gln) amidotransferase subunit A n=2 Tax=Holospora TaxID=44747 RepID=A0A061JHF7_9PROT|nr:MULTISPECIES: Asp-tRNA(Asn)/Glu-tRNA(Gln) amidotransferase subunit GatA [Holospora]ETZ04792.1 glutamyl-tRNA(Gln) amidotransferase subunit A [Holospora undulata HU1]GAJ45702.1 glutamyl-tRNA(Gln) amidotransferase subunit A [Holospora elegans E1]